MKKIVVLLSIILALVCLSPATKASAAEASSGQWGDLYWSYQSGQLYVYGNGNMPDASNAYDTPWFHLAQVVETIYIDDGITSIGNYAFQDFRKAVTLRLPNTLTRVGEYAFYGCVNLYWILDGNLEQKLPDSLQIIEEGGFEACQSLVDLNMGEGVTYVGPYAFFGLMDMRNLTLSSNLQTIETYAFCGCYSLKSVIFPETLEYIGHRAFGDDYPLKSIQFTGDAPNISSTAFMSFVDPVNATVFYPQDNPTWTADKLQNYGGMFTWQAMPSDCIAAGTCGENVTWTLSRNGQMTLSGTGPMYDYHCLENLDYAPWYTIRHKITSLVVEEGVTNIGTSAFYKCFDLVQVTLPDSVTTLKQSAFFDCEGLKTMEIGPNVTSIEPYALYACAASERFTVDPKNPNYCSDSYGVLYDKNKTLLIQVPCTLSGHYAIPQGVVEIGDSSFSGCDQLTGITIPNSVTTIGNSAFSCCWSIRSVTIPKSVTLIRHAAFWCCEAIETIQFLGDAPVFEEDQIFVHVNGVATYPANNPTWTPDKFVHTDSDMTWVAVEPQIPAFCIPALDNALFYTLEEAMAVYDPELHYIQLQKAITVDVTLKKDLHIDLNGYNMDGTIRCGDYGVYGRDTATDSYKCRKLGYFTCVDERGCAIVPQHEYQPKVRGTIMRYMTIPSDRGYSFHRFSLSIEYLSLDPSYTAFGYRSIFKGDDMVRNYVSAVGYKLWITEDRIIHYTQPGFKSDLSLRLKNFDITNHGETAVNAKVTMTLPDGTVFESTPRRSSMRTMVEEINNKYTALTELQLTLLQKMLAKFPITKTWKIQNLL